MTKYQSDQKIAESLKKHLPDFVKDREQSISNSLLVESNKGSFIIYLVRGKNQELLMVVINLSFQDQRKSVRFITVTGKNEYLLENMRFEITQCPYFSECYSLIAYDPKQNSQTVKDTIVCFTNLSLQQIELLKSIQLYIVPTRQYGQVKDVKWYPFASLTLIVLTQSRILTIKLDFDYNEPIAEIQLRDLKVSITNQSIRNGHFEEIAFAEILNLKEQYSSIGRKLTLYLITRTGQIFLIFPFICPQVLLDQNQQRSYREMRQNHKNQRGISLRSNNITELFKRGNIVQIQDDEDPTDQYLSRQNEENTNFVLKISSLQNFRVELIKLNPVTFYSRQDNGLRNGCQSVSSFKVLTLNRHTLFLHRQRLTSKQQELKVQILSQEPYDKLMIAQASLKSENFALETVGQFKFDIYRSNIQSETIRLITQKSMTNEIFLLHNNLTCYRLSFDGLSTLLTGNGEQISDKLIDCDVLFKSNTQLFSIAKNLHTLFFIRYENGTYLFQSIPLQSIQLREIIRSTIEQTETLFKKLANQPEPKSQTSGQKPPTLDFEKLDQATLISIEKKLNSFNNDSKKYIETKLQKIKRLSQNVISKQSILEQQHRQKQQLIKLITQAQQNDRRIKEITSKNSQNLNKTQRELERRIKAMNKNLDELKLTFEKQNKTIEEDQEKQQIMIQCIMQTDAIINRLEETKSKLLEKRDQLVKSLALA